MSRYYEMTVEISGHNPEKVSHIKTAAEAEWPFGGWWSSGVEDIRVVFQPKWHKG